MNQASRERNRHNRRLSRKRRHNPIQVKSRLRKMRRTRIRRAS